ncbi:ABC transporter substrate-binding protein [Budviciaceae bacterium BWR-B9]|uniref:ABC transporter substrate-binding protein n=1 Tax=Limnobaculum allomyrinae TaxID=2791986 RepID=A0ABS1IQ60_9GAMM|nr:MULTISPECIES: ABC transporter substrate-binding protein [Limnobaculum]MBK5143878.1 ABC transporter substrate-binding protein [Limnobaculum allomyrinae]MBV7691536.1 ABC transporter substrate-binding protein [Limnobaculum sp. M2-1]
MSKKSNLFIVSMLTLSVGSALAAPENYPADYQKIVDAANKEGKVVIYSTTDTAAAAPIIKGFETLYPNITVEYNDMNSTELYNRYISEQASSSGSGDVVWSSAMDTGLKLATDYALTYKSPEASKIPTWAVWKDTAYGTTYEPLVFIYNKRLIKEDEIPKSHAALGELVKSQPDRFKNKVTTYDIEKSALGFMLSVEDMKNDPKYWDHLKDISSAGMVVQSSTGTMLERVSSGENLIGYNILEPYAKTRAVKDPSLGIAYPSDYTLVLSRVTFISKQAKNVNAAKLWLDYLLSQKGQDIVANQANITSIRDDINGDNDVAGTTKLLGNSLKPIPVNETLLEYLEQNKRLDYLKKWRSVTGK